jgi:hypothetical protein
MVQSLEKFQAQYEKLHPPPQLPVMEFVWSSPKFLGSLVVSVATLALSGLRTYSIFSRVSILGFVDPLFAVFTLEATIGIGILSLAYQRTRSTVEPTRGWLATATWVISIIIAVLIAILTNGIFMIEKMGVVLEAAYIDWASVIMMGIFIPVLGILHIPFLTHDIRYTNYVNNIAQQEYQQAHSAWVVEMQEVFRTQPTQTSTAQRITKENRQAAIFASLSEGEVFDEAKINEAAAYFGVLPGTIKRDIASWKPDASTTF